MKTVKIVMMCIAMSAVTAHAFPTDGHGRSRSTHTSSQPHGSTSTKPPSNSGSINHAGTPPKSFLAQVPKNQPRNRRGSSSQGQSGGNPPSINPPQGLNPPKDPENGPSGGQEDQLSFNNYQPTYSPPVSVPEPGSLALIAAGLAGLVVTRRFAK